MASYTIGSSAICDVKKWKDQLQSFMASSESVEDFSENTILCNWTRCYIKLFAAMHSERKPMTGPLKIEKTKSFYHEMKITGKCTCPEGSNKMLLVRR